MIYFLPVLLQLMVVGRVGVLGHLVVNPAEQVFRNVLGAATNRRPVMAGKRAKERRGKVMGATRSHVLVRTTSIFSFCRVLSKNVSQVSRFSVCVTLGSAHDSLKLSLLQWTVW